MASILTYDQADTNREHLLDVVTNISPEETPMFSSFRKVSARATLVEWPVDALADAALNQAVEGADYSFAALDARTREYNYTQILTKEFQVSATQEAVDKAGVESEYAYQAEKAMKEWARDAEYSIVNGVRDAGSSGAAREMNGVLAFITTNDETGSGSGTEALTEDMFNDCLQEIWDEGGRPDTVYANGFQKRAIDAFSTPNTRYISGEDGVIRASVAVYDSSFGRLAVVLDRYMASDKVAILQQDKWAVGVLREPKQEEVAKIGDSMRGAIVGEMTLISYNEKASGKITQLTTS